MRDGSLTLAAIVATQNLLESSDIKERDNFFGLEVFEKKKNMFIITMDSNTTRSLMKDTKN